MSSSGFYYQIKAVAVDGSVKYSKVVTLTREVTTTLKVVPNPVHKSMQLVISSDNNTEATILIIDVSGRIVYQVSHKLNKGMNVISIPAVQSWPQGSYFVKARCNGITNSVQFNIQH